jgi:DHA2 family multidrug resistance protein
MNKHLDAEWKFAQKLRGSIFARNDFGNFMAILDIQIVASSLNEVQAGMSASRYEVTWVQTVYLIAEIIAIPMSSIVSRVLSTRVYYTICAIGFTVSSLLCALAWNLESLLVVPWHSRFYGRWHDSDFNDCLIFTFSRTKTFIAFGCVWNGQYFGSCDRPNHWGLAHQ